jgi:outer membrane protein assembly factor BamB
VYAGDYNGRLYALNERTGVLLWSGQAGNQFFDPDYITAVGSLVFTVTISPGNTTPAELSAWAGHGCGSSFCNPLWTANLAAAASGPAVRGNTVFVAESNGWLYAYKTLCGTPCLPLWSGLFYPTSTGDVFDSLAIANGTVYVTNGTIPWVSAFPASGCGARLCIPIRQYQVGNSFRNNTYFPGLAVANGILYVGTGTRLDAFKAQCGIGVICPLLWQDRFAPGAKPLVANGVVYAVSGSTVLADNGSTGARLWQTSTAPANGSSTGGPAVANGTLYVEETAGAEVLAYHL